MDYFDCTDLGARGCFRRPKERFSCKCLNGLGVSQGRFLKSQETPRRLQGCLGRFSESQLISERFQEVSGAFQEVSGAFNMVFVISKRI